MKRLVSLMLIFLIVLPTFALFTPKARASENVIFQDDFESYAVGTFPSSGGWQIVWNGAGDQYQVVTNSYSNSPTKSLHLMGSYGWSVVVKRDFSSSSSIIGYETYMMASPGGGGDVAFCNIPIETWGRYYAMVGFGTDGYIFACEKNNEGIHQLQPFTPHTWYKIRVVIDRTAKLYDVWIDDVLKRQDIPIYYDPWEILSLQFQVGWVNITNYFDDAKVFEASEAPPEGGLVGYWKLDEGSGNTAVDSSGKGNTGTLQNGPVWVDGKEGKALGFDGVDDFVQVTDSSSLHLSTAVTVEAWVYLPTGADFSQGRTILSKDASNGGTGLNFGICNDAGGVQFGVGTDGVYSPIIGVDTPTGYVPRDVWTHVAATYDGSLMKAYVNGVLCVSNPWTGGINTDNGMPLTLGKKNFYPWSYEYWMNGSIDEVKMYNRALSPQEIQTDMEAPGAGASTSVSCSPNPGSIFQPVTCTATVSGFSPTGTITWSTSSMGGSFSQFTCTLSNGACSTTYIDNFTGSVTIVASYSGDSNNMPSSGSNSLIVTSGGPIYYSANYTSVQAAIDAAPSGATVIIAPGFYTEFLIVNKPLTIIGEKDPPVFSGGASAIYLTLLSGASGSNVTGIEITYWPEGILVVNASHCSIYGNIMAFIGSSGIVLEGSNATHNFISNNIFQDTPTPINLTASAGNNTFYGNIITSQTSVTLNIGADGNSVYGNSISGNGILVNMTNSNGNLIYHNNFLTVTNITVVATGNNSWDDGYPSGGNYWSIAPHVVGSNNTDHYPLMKPWPLAAGHCVAVISVVAAKIVIGQGFNCSLTVCAGDNGEYSESFSVTAYANITGIGTRQVNGLNASCQMVLTFAWNTADLAYGNYTVSAYAQPVAGQTDVSGNGFTLGTVKVTIPGDVNGDFKVGLPDLVLLAQAYGSKPSNNNWNSNADIDGNNVAGLSDLVTLAQHYGQHYP
jgi:hypothetical protein